MRNASYKNLNNPVFTDALREALDYERNGNITHLERYGKIDLGTDSSGTLIDDLTYSYGSNSNQLKKVVDLSNSTLGFKDDATNGNDSQDDYTYDIYGNMTLDQNKTITTIVYNHLNLPLQINFANGGTIKYVYDATGVKQSKTVTVNNTGSTTKYLNGFQYTSQAGSSSGVELQFFPTAEGYVNVSSLNGTTLYSYVYHYKDHLGNIRLSYSLDPTTQTLTTLEEHHYYPFGLEHVKQIEWNITPALGPQGIKPTYTQVANNGYQYQYQSQERQDELGLNWDSFKYRNYDYAIGRFMSIDPLSESFYHNGTYNFAENRVIDGFELEGLEWVDTDSDWQYQGYDYGPSPVPQNAIGVAPQGSRPVASWVSQEPIGIPFTGTVSTLNVGGPDGTVQQFTANDSGMVELPFSGTEQTGLDSSGTYDIDGHTVYGYYNRNDVEGTVEDQWGSPQNISNMINAITEFDMNTLLDNPLQIGDMRSPLDGRTNISANSTHHGNNGAFDIRLLGINGGLSGGTTINNNNFSTKNTQLFINALGNNGFTRFLIGPNAVPNLNNSGTINVHNGGNIHNNHYHIDVD